MEALYRCVTSIQPSCEATYKKVVVSGSLTVTAAVYSYLEPNVCLQIYGYTIEPHMSRANEIVIPIILRNRLYLVGSVDLFTFHRKAFYRFM